MKSRLPQSPSARWLLGIALAVAAIVVASVVLVLVRQPERTLLPEDTPEGIVQRYVIAIQRRDYPEAYSYLSAKLQEYCTYSYFSDTARYWLADSVSVELRDTRALDSRVIVEIRIINEDASPFPGMEGYSHTEQFVLSEESGKWRFSEPPPPARWCPGLEGKPAPTPTEVQ